MKLILVLFYATLMSFILAVPISEKMNVSTKATTIVFLSVVLISATTKSPGLNMKVLWGALVVDGRGKINGFVAAKNRAGNYFRTKISPVNRRTTFQINVRGLLVGFSQFWRTLTDVQRLGWSNYANATTYRDIFGNTRTLSGNSMYVRTNINLDAVGVAPITDAPTPQASTTITSLTIAAAAGAGTLAVTFAPTPVPADVAYEVWATPSYSAGKAFIQNKYRLIGFINAAGTSPSAQGANYQVRFGLPVEAQKISVRVVPVSKLSGQVGLGQEAVCTVAA